MIHEYVHLDVPSRHHQQVSEHLSRHASPGPGVIMLGCWSVEIGPLNTVVMLRGFESDADYFSERRRLQYAEDPFGCAEVISGYHLDAYLPLDWFDPVPAGDFGPYYEIRTYGQRLGGMATLSAAWQRKLPARAELSPALTAGTSLDGMPRFTHLWPYRSLDERARIRTEAVERGLWPPNAFPGSLPPPMKTMICLPLPCSPLQ